MNKVFVTLTSTEERQNDDVRSAPARRLSRRQNVVRRRRRRQRFGRRRSETQQQSLKCGSRFLIDFESFLFLFCGFNIFQHLLLKKLLEHIISVKTLTFIPLYLRGFYHLYLQTTLSA